MLDFLTHNINTDYRHIKLGECTYKVKENTLFVVFLFSHEVDTKISELKPRLEKEFLEKIGSEVKTVFKYKKSYTDEILLKLQIKKMLTAGFSILTLDLDDEDICIEKNLNDGYTINLYLAEQCIEYIKQSKTFTSFVRKLHDENFCTFEFFFDVKKTDETDSATALEKLEQYMSNTLPKNAGVKVDKTLRVREIEYWLGKPIKARPIQVQYLRISGDEQITAGEIKFLAKREFIRKNKDTGAEESRTYWTFVLDDGHSRISCVFFPTDKTYSKFDKLTDGTTICAIGIYGERNGRASLRVSGVSFCELI